MSSSSGSRSRQQSDPVQDAIRETNKAYAAISSDWSMIQYMIKAYGYNEHRVDGLYRGRDMMKATADFFRDLFRDAVKPIIEIDDNVDYSDMPELVPITKSVSKSGKSRNKDQQKRRQ